MFEADDGSKDHAFSASGATEEPENLPFAEITGDAPVDLLLAEGFFEIGDDDHFQSYGKKNWGAFWVMR
jgi:hypothetical protein